MKASESCKIQLDRPFIPHAYEYGMNSIYRGTDYADHVGPMADGLYSGGKG